MNWQNLDLQMQFYANELKSQIGLKDGQSARLATFISEEMKSLSNAIKNGILISSPVHPNDRLLELRAFQIWMDKAHDMKDPFISRAQIITQNYICFVYLPESCFKILSKSFPSNSVTRKCSKFLTDNPVRAFRNAIAHANWTYSEDCTSIIYWAKKDSSVDDSLIRFEVTSIELAFWQALSRCVAYVSYTTLAEK